MDLSLELALPRIGDVIYRKNFGEDSYSFYYITVLSKKKPKVIANRLVGVNIVNDAVLVPIDDLFRVYVMDNGKTIFMDKKEILKFPEIITSFLKDFKFNTGDCADIRNVRVVVPNKVVEVTFRDGTKEKAVCSEPDVFSLEQGIGICISKHIMGGSATYNKAIKRGIKVYERGLLKEKVMQEEAERIKRKKEKKKEQKQRREERYRNEELGYFKQALREVLNEYVKK